MGTLAVTATLALVIVLCGRNIYNKWSTASLTACQLDPHPWSGEGTEKRPAHPTVYRVGMTIMYGAFAVMLVGVAAAVFRPLTGGGLLHAGSWLGLLGYGLTVRAEK